MTEDEIKAISQVGEAAKAGVMDIHNEPHGTVVITLIKRNDVYFEIESKIIRRKRLTDSLQASQ